MMQKKREVSAPKPEPKPKVNKQVNPSQKLAALLHREAVLAARARKAKDDLKSVQEEIRTTWQQRERHNEELLGSDPEV